jgi:DDE superfamily endonuclease
MPRTSIRAKLIQLLQGFAILEEIFPADDTEENDDIFDLLEDEYARRFDFTSPASVIQLISSRRYLNVRAPVPKSRHWVNNVLNELDDERFKTETRVSRNAFDFILEKIKDHPIFHRSEKNNQQLPVENQLHIALYRFGRYGNGASIRDIANHAGIGEGTVEKITRRIITALLSLEPQYLCWYSQGEKNAMKARIDATFGFPECIGFLDGTSVILDLKPEKNHQDYYNRKSRYAINAQILCDLDWRIRYSFVGYPGSVHDSACIGYSSLVNEANAYFDSPEYVLVDSAYPLTDNFIPSFKRPLADTEPYKSFNTEHSIARVHVEQCIGQLKGRFQSLRGMRIQIIDSSDNKRFNDWFTACCVLHNMLLEIDRWDDDDDGTEDNSGMEDDDRRNNEGGIGGRYNKNTAVQKRERLVQRVLGLL